MTGSEQFTYDRMASAIEFILENKLVQPSLDDVAKHVGMSSSHFQRSFTDFVGTSPKRFLQFCTLNHAKSLLQKQHTLFDTTEEVGLSSTSRLHDLFVTIEAMTPADYKNGGRNLSISYSFHETIFGKIIVASTTIGVCHLHFYTDEDSAFSALQNEFPNANYQKKTEGLHLAVLPLFKTSPNDVKQLKLHLKGTDFQLKVWSALLKISTGELSTYGAIAEKINQPTASRAVGTAIGNNPVALLIPCHRVVRQSGEIGGYMWGETRKRAILASEHSSTHSE